MEFDCLSESGRQLYPDAICICGIYIGNRFEPRIELITDCLLV